MTGWYLTRVNNKLSKFMNLLIVFSMVVPFQMVMFTLSKTADTLKLNTPWNICIIYLGFGAGLAVFMFTGFMKSVPMEIEEAATIDGAGPWRRFWRITLPMLAPAMTICIVGITTGSLKVYDLLVSSTNGGPGRASTSIIYYTYSTAINGRQYGYGSALTISVVAALLLVAFLQVKVLKKREVQM